MVQFGANAVGNPTFGGGVSGIIFDGQSTASYGLYIKDAQHARFDNLAFLNCASAQIYVTNSTNGGAQEPTGFLNFENIFMHAVAGGAAGCHGIFLDGKNAGGAEGVTLSAVRSLRIDHHNGDAVRFGDFADNWVWDHLFMYRWPGGSGWGVHAASTSSSQSTGGQTFYKVSSSAPWFSENPWGLVSSTMLFNGDNDGNANPADNMLYGALAFNVSQLSSAAAKLFGPMRVGGWHDTVRQDSMQFMHWDSVNNVVHTANGAWKTGVNGVGNSIHDKGAPRGSVVLQTAATAGNAVYILDASLGSGATIKDGIQAAFIGTPLSPDTNGIYRVGYFADVADPPDNAIYVEGALGTNSSFRCICSSGGTSTAVVSPVGVGQAYFQWRIEVAAGPQVNFWYRASGYDAWGLAASISTNVPGSSAVMSFGAYVKTRNASAHGYSLADVRSAFTVEI